MIRPYTQDEAVELIGHAPSYRKIKHELDHHWSQLHGLIVSSGYLQARIYDPVDEVYEYIFIEELAEGWVWDDGTPVGVEA